MPKMKTSKTTKKRFKKTGSGKLRRQQAMRQHLFEAKPSSRTRRLDGTVDVHKGDARKIKAGSYELEAGVTPRSLLKQLAFPWCTTCAPQISQPADRARPWYRPFTKPCLMTACNASRCSMSAASATSA